MTDQPTPGFTPGQVSFFATTAVIEGDGEPVAPVPSPASLPSPWLLSEARDWTRSHRVEGVECPCCEQLVKEYTRALPAIAARVMIRMYREGREGRDWVNIPEMALRGGTGDGTKGQHWGLIEPQPGERDDGSRRTGWWRLTDLGRAFVTRAITVPKYAHIYNGETVSFSGPAFSIDQALGEKFNYTVLMEGRGDD